MNTTEITAVIKYILTAAQPLGSQDYYKKSRMTILRLAGVLSFENEGHIQNELSYVPKKILTWMLREARGGFKATLGNSVQPDHHFIHIVFCSFLFQPESCFP